MSLIDRITDALERNEKLDAAAKPASSFWGAALANPKLRDVLSGRALGHPLHPALVTVAAGSLFSATALDLTGRSTPAATRLTGIGLVAAIPTLASGWSDWIDLHDAEQRVGLVHASANAAGLGFYTVSFLRRARGGSGRSLGLLGALGLGVGGWLGGHLAYAQGVGVDTTAFQAGPQEWTDVTAVSDISERLSQVTVDGVALLVTLVDGSPVVLADRCTHRGAPLSDGERADGCVVCPWHASRFELASGAARQGPATRPQPSYETRVVDGRLQARRVEPRASRTNVA